MLLVGEVQLKLSKSVSLSVEGRPGTGTEETRDRHQGVRCTGALVDWQRVQNEKKKRQDYSGHQ